MLEWPRTQARIVLIYVSWNGIGPGRFVE